jgi:hypothetical protein
MRSIHTVLVREIKRKRPHEKTKRRWEGNAKTDVKKK